MLADVLTILFLVILEGLLSFDNALALAAMVSKLPEAQQKKALTYGIFGAFAFRFISLFFIVHFLENPWIKFIGGVYLCWLCVSSLRVHGENEIKRNIHASFWRTVILVELTDIVFSIDSILAAAALTQKLWIVVFGGILGIMAMRFVSSFFIELIKIFPRLEKSAFILVGIVGAKLLLESQQIIKLDFHTVNQPEFWIFWIAMAIGLASGFCGKKHFQLSEPEDAA